MTRYFVYDVFTKTAFGGNQLAVFPDATGLPPENLQKIAREFNFSETTFVFPPEDPAHTAKVRIFTPTTELPFAGHPLIGTAIALADEGGPKDMTLELKLGPIKAQVSDSGAQFTVATPLRRASSPDASLVARTLGLDTDKIVTTTHAPVQAGHGAPFVCVELTDTETLTACQPDLDAMRQAAKLHADELRFAILAYVRRDDRIDARMFAPLGGIPEDPATGSACAALAALLTEELSQNLSLAITQGEAMGRPSQITADTVLGDPVAVTIGGQAVRTMEGKFLV